MRTTDENISYATRINALSMGRPYLYMDTRNRAFYQIIIAGLAKVAE
jgi:hypothetical protein